MYFLNGRIYIYRFSQFSRSFQNELLPYVYTNDHYYFDCLYTCKLKKKITLKQNFQIE